MKFDVKIMKFNISMTNQFSNFFSPIDWQGVPGTCIPRSIFYFHAVIGRIGPNNRSAPPTFMIFVLHLVVSNGKFWDIWFIQNYHVLLKTEKKNPANWWWAIWTKTGYMVSSRSPSSCVQNQNLNKQLDKENVYRSVDIFSGITHQCSGGQGEMKERQSSNWRRARLVLPCFVLLFRAICVNNLRVIRREEENRRDKNKPMHRGGRARNSD